jgi:hypothetical protein
VLIRNLPPDDGALSMARRFAREGRPWPGASVKRIKALRQTVLRRLATLHRRAAPGGKRKRKG